MKQFICKLGKQSKICSDIEEAKEFTSRFGHLTSAGEKRLAALFDDVLTINRDFAWMMPKHIPELINYPEQHCRMWIKPFPTKKILPISEDEIRKAVDNM